jgi:hypothetical protein
MKRTIFVSLLVLTFLAVPVAMAANPHFVNASASLDNAGNLVVSWKEAGLGDNQLIDYTASANATAVYACINGGGKHPQASNKEEVAAPVSESGTFNSGKNGQITASLTVSPPGPGTFSCPNGQRLVLASVTYSNVMITDLTNNIQEAISGTFSKIFLVLQ